MPNISEFERNKPKETHKAFEDAIHFFPFGGIKELNSWVKSYSEAR